MHGSKISQAALGQKVIKPPRATLADLEARLREWNSDVKGYERINKQPVHTDLSLIYLLKMMPNGAKARYTSQTPIAPATCHATGALGTRRLRWGWGCATANTTLTNARQWHNDIYDHI